MPVVRREGSACLSEESNAKVYGFARTRRLLTASAYQRVFQAAARSSDNYLTVLARANDLGLPRLGLAISKKSIKLASQRNRIKRLTRETFRLNQHRFQGIDFVVMTRGHATHADHETLSRSLLRHWEHLVRQCKNYSSSSSAPTAT